MKLTSHSANAFESHPNCSLYWQFVPFYCRVVSTVGLDHSLYPFPPEGHLICFLCLAIRNRTDKHSCTCFYVNINFSFFRMVNPGVELLCHMVKKLSEFWLESCCCCCFQVYYSMLVPRDRNLKPLVYLHCFYYLVLFSAHWKLKSLFLSAFSYPLMGMWRVLPTVVIRPLKKTVAGTGIGDSDTSFLLSQHRIKSYMLWDSFNCYPWGESRGSGIVLWKIPWK